MIFHGDALTILRSQFAEESVQCCVTSPPYWGLRDYGMPGQLGLEKTPEEYVSKMVEVFAEVRRVLKSDGTLWLNLGDSYASNPSKGGSGPNGKNGYGENYGRELRKGSGRADGIIKTESPRNRDGTPPCELPSKNLIGIPWRVAFALQADGWYLRSDIIWHKPNPMPESVTDRPTKAHEYLFLLSKSERYYYDAEAIAEPNIKGQSGSYFDRGKTGVNGNGRVQDGERAEDNIRNKRTVWTIATQPYPEAHFATFPPKLIEPCILAGCQKDGLVLDPFAGSGTTLMVAKQLGRRGVGIELNADYIAMANERCQQESLPL